MLKAKCTSIDHTLGNGNHNIRVKIEINDLTIQINTQSAHGKLVCLTSQCQINVIKGRVVRERGLFL